MNQATTETRSVVVDRELPHPPEKIWRALTQPHLIEAWLMKSDFEPVAGRAFSFRADWGSVDCTVLAMPPTARMPGPPRRNRTSPVPVPLSAKSIV